MLEKDKLTDSMVLDLFGVLEPESNIGRSKGASDRKYEYALLNTAFNTIFNFYHIYLYRILY